MLLSWYRLYQGTSAKPKVIISPLSHPFAGLVPAAPRDADLSFLKLIKLPLNVQVCWDKGEESGFPAGCGTHLHSLQVLGSGSSTPTPAVKYSSCVAGLGSGPGNALPFSSVPGMAPL